MSEKLRIVYLYRELMAYNIPVLKALVSEGCSVTFIHRDQNRKTPMNFKSIEGVEFIPKSIFTDEELKEKIITMMPHLLFISDRTIPIYNKIGSILKKEIPVVCGNDSQWRGGKQWVNVFTSHFRHHLYYSHMMVAGVRQFEYAKRLGFRNGKIIWPLYSADVDKFSNININRERYEKSKDLLFVGRLTNAKGIGYLIDAWKRVSLKNSAKLHIVGKGDILEGRNLPKGIVLHEFLDQDKLKDLASLCRAFILPSIYEPWGVVIHEFASAGMPLIVTHECGAAHHFVLNGYNGFLIESKSVDQIEVSITKILRMDIDSLHKMGKRSRELSQNISPEMVANALLSCINR